MKTYLTVDLDYWANKYEPSTRGSEIQAKTFFYKIKNLNKPIFVCEYHDEVLKDLNKRKVDKIINVDFHSDIAYEDVINYPDPKSLNEGVWANFYKYRKNSIFEWHYPSLQTCFREGWGRCEWWPDSDVGPFQKKRMGYKKVFRRQGLNGIISNDIVGIGVCYSPNWCDSWIFDVFEEVFNADTVYSLV